jgi:hypothetical protein
MSMDMQRLPPGDDLFETPPCPLCDGLDAVPFIEAEDDLGGRPGRFRFQRCTACGLVYQTPRLAFPHIAAFYDDEYIAHRKKKIGRASCRERVS